MPTREKISLSFRLALAKLVHSWASVKHEMNTLLWEAWEILIKNSWRVDLNSHQEKQLEKHLGQEGDADIKSRYIQQVSCELTVKDRGGYKWTREGWKLGFPAVTRSSVTVSLWGAASASGSWEAVQFEEKNSPWFEDTSV